MIWDDGNRAGFLNFEFVNYTFSFQETLDNGAEQVKRPGTHPFYGSFILPVAVLKLPIIVANAGGGAGGVGRRTRVGLWARRLSIQCCRPHWGSHLQRRTPRACRSAFPATLQSSMMVAMAFGSRAQYVCQRPCGLLCTLQAPLRRPCSMRFVVCIPDKPVVFMVTIAMAFNAPVGAAMMLLVIRPGCGAGGAGRRRHRV